MLTSSERITQTVEKLREDKPVLGELLDTFAPLWLAREQEETRLAKDFAESGFTLPPKEEDRLSKGISLLTSVRLSSFWDRVHECANKLLPTLATAPKLQDHLDAVESFLKAGHSEQFQHDYLRALTDFDDESLAALVPGTDDERAKINFVLELAFSTVLRTLVGLNLEQDRDPWHLWTQGHCPVCGRLPIMEFFSKGFEDPKNPFLTTGGGRRYLHCGLCGADWRFRRAVCPACGSEEKGIINYLYTAPMSTEHLCYCDKCKNYCVGLDMRNLSPAPDLDVMALGLLPYDLLAAEKDIRPMCRTVWNQL